MGRAPILDVSAMPVACRHCAVRSRSLCGTLDAQELSAINAASFHKTFSEGQLIVSEGAPDLFANIVSGVVMEKKTLSDGREQIVSLLFPGDFMGNVFEGTAACSVEAVGRATVCSFDRARFERTVNTYPNLQHALLTQTQRHLRDAREWLLLLGQKTASERVATFLVRLADRSAEGSCQHIELDGTLAFELPITRAQMAAHLGLTIETVSRKLTALRRAGIIEIVDVRSVRVLDRDRLEAAAG